MSPHSSHPPSHKIRKSHIALGAILVGGGLVLVLRPAMGWLAAGLVAVPVGLAVAIHLGLLLAGSGALIAVLRARSRRQAGGAELGTTLHSPRLYDWMATGYTFGREARMRERTLDAARVVTGERVLDVGCGTGTLALAARKRVGETGSVHGVDASPEMIARARTKAERHGPPVSFDTAAAQSLPFPDASFDVVLCSLALHHLPPDARAAALAEMRRVLRPGGRALIVEFSRDQGTAAMLNPITLIHAFKNPRMLDEAAGLMQSSGFEPVVTGALGLAGMGYALGWREGDPIPSTRERRGARSPGP